MNSIAFRIIAETAWESLPNRYSSQILHREGIAGELKRGGNFLGACVPEKWV